MDPIYITYDTYTTTLRDFKDLLIAGWSFANFILIFVRLGHLTKKTQPELVNVFRSKILKTYRNTTVGNTNLPAPNVFDV